MASELASVLDSIRSGPRSYGVLRRPSDRRPITNGELLTRCQEIARQLRMLIPADRLVALTPDSPISAVELALGALLAKVPFLPVDVREPQAAVDRVLRRAGGIPFTGEASRGLHDRTADESSPPLPAGLAYAVSTSGTTGTPKIVLVGTRALGAYLPAVAHRYDLGPGDVVLQGAPFGFDVWLEEVLPTLAWGGRVVLADHGWRLSYQSLMRLIHENGITVLNLPSSYWEGWVDHLERARWPMPDSLRLVIVGSERVAGATAQRWLKMFSDRPRLLAAYGLAEATITSLTYDVTAFGVPQNELSVPLGTPLPNCKVRLVPAGEGELQLASPSLFEGYLDDPDGTAARVWVDQHGTRWLRTGDYGAEARDGTIHYLGRRDDQVKVSGFRVSLSDVRDALESLEPVQQAVVLQMSPGEGLSAVIVTADGTERPELLERLRLTFPAYQVPAELRFVKSLPRLASGKTDLQTIRAWFHRTRAASPHPTSKSAGALDTLLACASRLLQREVSFGDSFFALGGNSLLAIRLVSELELAGITVELNDLFQTTSMAELAARAQTTSSRVAIPRRPPGTVRGPLTQQQLSVWYHLQLYPESAAYNAQSRLDIHGKISVAALQAALMAMTCQHEALRTSFHEDDDGTPYQLVHDQARVRFSTVDRRGLSAGLHERLAVEQELLGRRFDLNAPPLAEWTLVTYEEEEHALYVVEHHLIHDGVSFAILMQDLCEHMSHRGVSSRPKDQVGYLDYALWQHEELRQGRYDSASTNWAEKLRGVPDIGVLVERARTAGLDRKAGVLITYLDKETARSARSAAHQQRTTLFVFLLTIFSRVLAQQFQQRFAIGVSVANRLNPETARTVGMFVNTVAIPFDWRDAGFAEMLRRTHSLAGEAYTDQALPFSLLVKKLNPPRVHNSTPVYQVTFNFDDAPLPSVGLRDAHAEVIELQSGYAKVDLSLVAVPQREQRLLHGEGGGREEMRLIFQYRRTVLHEEEVTALAEAFVAEVRRESET
jgi:non-ribosomal peptide synthetase component F